jgi:dipeptidyl aminopeptidase/acylaminoacyl peptidase
MKNRIAAGAIFLVSICFALIFLVPRMSSKQSVLSELVQLQKQNGLRLVAVRDNKLFTVSYASRTLDQSKPLIAKGTAGTGTVSPDGTKVAITYCPDPEITDPKYGSSECRASSLATVRPDGSDLKEYRDLANMGFMFCWSHDMSKVVGIIQDRRQGRYARYSLQIVDLASGRTEVIEGGPSVFVDSQCWSPDDRRLVYTRDQESGIRTVRMYDTETKKSRGIASGGHATWSPDGHWIAFLDCPATLRGCKYYGIQTSTSERKLFFEKDGQTGLSWSPDSRFVAYVDPASVLEKTPLEQLREMLRLRVRRLDDGAEDSLVDFYDGNIMWFDWVSPP